MAGYFGAEVPMIDQWIEQKLKVDAAGALNAIATDLSTRVYNEVGPEGIDYPFIVYQTQDDPAVVRGVGSAEVMVDTIYVVKAIAQGVSYEALAQVASAIRDALVSDNGESIVGGIGNVFTCRYERQIRLSTVEQGNQFRHLGGAYRIQARAV